MGEFQTVTKALGRSLADVKSELVAVKSELVALRRQPLTAAPALQSPGIASKSPSARSPTAVRAPPAAAQPPTPFAFAAVTQSTGSDVEALPLAAPPSESPDWAAIRSLLPMGAAAPSPKPAALSLTMESYEFFLEATSRGHGSTSVNAPKFADSGDSKRARQCMEWFDSMATTEERALFKPPRPGFVAPDKGGQRREAEKLQALVSLRIAEEWTNQGKKVPRELAKNNLTVNALDNRLRDLRNGKAGTAATISTSKQAFYVWRTSLPEGAVGRIVPEQPASAAAVPPPPAAPEPAAAPSAGGGGEGGAPEGDAHTEAPAQKRARRSTEGSMDAWLAGSGRGPRGGAS